MFVLYLMWEILFQTFIWEIVVPPRVVSDSSRCPSMHVHHDKNQRIKLHEYVWISQMNVWNKISHIKYNTNILNAILTQIRYNAW